jgi:2-dehydropantoate 2-reductase
VDVATAPYSGVLDVGRYPAGVDATATAIAAAFASSTFSAEPRPDVMRWKYGKLLSNLANAVDALCGPEVRSGEVIDRARAEGAACLHAAGIDYVTAEEDVARRRGVMPAFPGPRAERRSGSSSWQSLARRTGSIEADYLNGEIVLLGRLHGVATPVNELLTRLANRAAAQLTPPGSMSIEELTGLLPPG